MRFHGTYLPRGVFVCFEGGDGSGKSTQSRLLAERLEALGHVVRLTFEPGDTPVGRRCAASCSRPRPASCHTAPRCCSTPPTSPSTSTPWSSRRWSGARSSSRTATSTRRWPTRAPAATSTSARSRRSRAGRPATSGRTSRSSSTSTRATASGRFEGRDRIEVEGLEFHDRARQLFLDLAAADPDHYLVLDGRADRDVLADQVLARLEPLLGQATAQRVTGLERRERYDRLGRPGRPAPDRRAAAHRGGRPRHEPRVAVHRAARAPVAPTRPSRSPPRCSASRRARTTRGAAPARSATPCWPGRTPT